MKCGLETYVGMLNFKTWSFKVFLVKLANLSFDVSPVLSSHIDVTPLLYNDSSVPFDESGGVFKALS